jgi:hypothetical protein
VGRILGASPGKSSPHLQLRRLTENSQSVLAAVNSRTSAVLGDWKMPEKNLGLKGRNLKGLNEIRRSSAKSIGGVAASA